MSNRIDKNFRSFLIDNILSHISSWLSATYGINITPSNLLDIVDNVHTCSYVFNRGIRKGTQCNMVCQPNSEYCRYHQHRATTNNTVKDQHTSCEPIIPSLPKYSIEVHPDYYNGVPGMYLETNNRFILKQLPNQNIEVIGVLDNDNNERELNDNERVIAESLGLIVKWSNR